MLQINTMHKEKHVVFFIFFLFWGGASTNAVSSVQIVEEEFLHNAVEKTHKARQVSFD